MEAHPYLELADGLLVDRMLRQDSLETLGAWLIQSERKGNSQHRFHCLGVSPGSIDRGEPEIMPESLAPMLIGETGGKRQSNGIGVRGAPRSLRQLGPNPGEIAKSAEKIHQTRPNKGSGRYGRRKTVDPRKRLGPSVPDHEPANVGCRAFRSG